MQIKSTEIQTQPVQWPDLDNLTYFGNGLVYVLSSQKRMANDTNDIELSYWQNIKRVPFLWTSVENPACLANRMGMLLI